MTILEDKEGEFLDDAQHVLLERFADCHSGVVVFIIIDVGNFSKIYENKRVTKKSYD